MTNDFWEWSKVDEQGRCRKMGVGCSVMERTTELQRWSWAWSAWLELGCDKSGEMREVTLLGARTRTQSPLHLEARRMIPATADEVE